MARLINLYSEDRSVQVQVAPDNGGMIAQIFVEGKPMLRLHEDKIDMTPIAAGGIPVMFPFSSKVRDDSYEMDGVTYGMPMHGLVKNEAFGIREVTDQKVILWTENNPCWLQSQYPFSFELEVTYKLEGNTVVLQAAVENRSDKPMPHTLGWHTYHLANDKTKFELTHHMTAHFDYFKDEDVEMPGEMDLSQFWDDVFHTPTKHEYTLVNREFGYEAHCTYDEIYDCLVVCSWAPEAMCVEPWCGVPNSMRHGQHLKWIEPGAREVYTVKLDFKLI